MKSRNAQKMKLLTTAIVTLMGLLTSCALGSKSPAPSEEGDGLAEEPRYFSDVTLVGYWHRSPHIWDAARFAPHVSWKAPDGKEQWLFEGFLFLEGSDWTHDRTFVLGPGKSATQTEWQYQLDLWLGPEGCISELEKACSSVASRIGNPPSRRGVIISIPDAIMFESFSDKQSPTVYWGDGLDFARVEDRLTALYWYIDSAR